MDLNLLIQLIIFWVLVALSYIVFKFRGKNYIKNKSIQNWTIDLLGLVIQGQIIPACQSFLLVPLFFMIIPTLNGSFTVGKIGAIALNFIFVDYVYYWAHRILHRRKFFPIHYLHHTSKQMDVFVTSRNNLWASFFLPYIWLNGLFFYLVDEKSTYIFSVTLTAMLDLWRHAEVVPSKKNTFYHFLSIFLITPYEHAYHHSVKGANYNYGANLSLWDKIHHSYKNTPTYPKELGLYLKGTLFNKLFRPYTLLRRLRES